MASYNEAMDALLAEKAELTKLFEESRRDRVISRLKRQNLGVEIFIRRLEKAHYHAFLEPEEAKILSLKCEADILIMRREQANLKASHEALMEPFRRTGVIEDLSRQLNTEKRSAASLYETLSVLANKSI